MSHAYIYDESIPAELRSSVEHRGTEQYDQTVSAGDTALEASSLQHAAYWAFNRPGGEPQYGGLAPAWVQPAPKVFAPTTACD